MVLPVLAPGDVVRIRDERWVVTAQRTWGGVSILDVCGRDRTNREDRASFVLPFETVEPLPAVNAPRRVRRRPWRRIARAIVSAATPSWEALSTPLRARISLLPFQFEPALAITHGAAARILIADEVGLGKTIQASLIVAELLARTHEGRVLVVAPASLREQWQAELRERFGLQAWVADAASLAHLSTRWRDVHPWAAHSVTITSIDFVKRPEVMRSLEPLVWDAVVFDEAHSLTGRSDRAVAAAALGRRGRAVVLLTATPHNGDDAAFESLCRVGDLRDDFPLLVFRRTRRDVGLTLSRRTLLLRVRPTVAERDMHRALDAYARQVRAERARADGAHLAMTVLTRRACSSPASLARSIERRLHLLADGETSMRQMPLPLFERADDEEPWLELAAPGLHDREEERQRLEQIVLLARRAQSAESKLRALTRLLRRTNEPAIVFTEYRDTLAHLATALHGWMPLTLHGGMTTAERQRSLRQFTTGTGRLLLATDAASEGLNLQQRCRLVIHLELPWTPLRVEQRVGRVERLGQQRRVHTVHLVARGTAEESFVARLAGRSERANDVLEALRPERDGEHAGIGTRPPITAALQSVARREATRLETHRLLLTSIAEPVFDARPLMMVRRRRIDGGSIWAFHASFASATGRPIWQTLIAARSSSRLRHEKDGRALSGVAAELAAHLEVEQRALLDSLASTAGVYAALAARRERAIAEALQHEHARLSEHLLQPGLFDRRSQHALAAQTTVLREALCRCRERVDDLAAVASPVSLSLRLAFALLCR